MSIDVMDTVELCKRLFGELGGLLDFFFEVDEVAKEDKNLQVSKTRWKELKTENGDAMPALWKDCREVSFGVDLTTPKKPKVNLYLKEEQTVDCSFLFQNIDNTVIDFDGKIASMKDYSEIKNYWKITMGGELADEI